MTKINFPEDFPPWLKDLYVLAEKTSFGKVEVRRNRHRTDMLEFHKSATIAPKTNEDAFLDLQTLLNNLVTSKYRGKLQFAIDFEKEGIITLITIKNKEIKTYGT